MDEDELIKALLSLCLSQNVKFAKRIINILKDNKRSLDEKKISSYGQ